MKKQKRRLGQYWYVLLAIIVGCLALTSQLIGTHCSRPIMTIQTEFNQSMNCVGNNYVSPLAIISVYWLAIVISLMKTIDFIYSWRKHQFSIGLAAPFVIAASYFGGIWAMYFVTLVICILEVIGSIINPWERIWPNKKTNASVKLVMNDVKSIPGCEPKLILSIISAIDPGKDRMMRIVQACAIKYSIAPVTIHNLRKSPKKGYYGRLLDGRLVIGSRAFLESNKIKCPDELDNDLNILVAINGKYIGGITFIYR